PTAGGPYPYETASGVYHTISESTCFPITARSHAESAAVILAASAFWSITAGADSGAATTPLSAGFFALLLHATVEVIATIASVMIRTLISRSRLVCGFLHLGC